MAQQNINNAGYEGDRLRSVNSQVTNIQAPERVATDKSMLTPDFAQAPKGPAVPSDKNHMVQPESAEDMAMRNRAVNLNLEFRDEDDYDSVTFALAENDQQSILVDRNPNAESHRIIDATMMDVDAMDA